MPNVHKIPDNEPIVTLTPLGNSGPGGGDTSSRIGRTWSADPVAGTLDHEPHSRANSRVTSDDISCVHVDELTRT